MNKLDQRFNLLDIFFLTDDNQEGPRIMISLISSTVLVLPREGERTTNFHEKKYSENSKNHTNNRPDVTANYF